VLEEMGKSRTAGRLVLRTHAVPEIDRNRRERAILVQNHGQPVFKRVLLVHQRLSPRGREGQQHQHENRDDEGPGNDGLGHAAG